MDFMEIFSDSAAMLRQIDLMRLKIAAPPHVMLSRHVYYAAY